MKPNATFEGLSGAAMLVLWIFLQAFTHPGVGGFIHVFLGLGVVLIVRGIVTSAWGTPTPH